MKNPKYTFCIGETQKAVTEADCPDPRAVAMAVATMREKFGAFEAAGKRAEDAILGFGGPMDELYIGCVIGAERKPGVRHFRITVSPPNERSLTVEALYGIACASPDAEVQEIEWEKAGIIAAAAPLETSGEREALELIQAVGKLAKTPPPGPWVMIILKQGMKYYTEPASKGATAAARIARVASHALMVLAGVVSDAHEKPAFERNNNLN